MASKLKFVVLIIVINLLMGSVAYVGYRAGQYESEIEAYYQELDEEWYEEMSKKYRRI